MKRIALWFSATTTAVLLLLGYHTSLSGAAAVTSPKGVAAAGVVAQATTTSATPAPASTASDAATTAPAATTVTVNGTAVATRYGDIQVQVQVTGGKVVKATAIAYSTRGRDGEINSYAIPQLQAETLSAQSATIDTVSGATYTSEGYKQSLQSALDAAHLS